MQVHAELHPARNIRGSKRRENERSVTHRGRRYATSRGQACAAEGSSSMNLLQELEVPRGITCSGQPVRPSLGAVQYGDDLNDVAFDPIGYNMRCAGDDEFACAGDATRSAEGGGCGQAHYRRPNSLDHAARRSRVFRRDPLTNVFEPAKIAGSIFEAAGAHRGCNSRPYRSSACFLDKASPESSSFIPSAISPICHSLSST